MLYSIQYVVLLVSLNFPLISTKYLQNYPKKSIYNKLTLENQFSGFAGLIRHNRDAQNSLMDDALTVFVPTNQAFESYDKPIHSEIVYYHMSPTYKVLDDLVNTRNLSSTNANFPKLWIKETNDHELYVNNAKIIQIESDYFGHGRTGPGAKRQVLHIIDEVLDPLIRRPKFSPTAYDFLSFALWDLNFEETFTSFLYKIQDNELNYLYKQLNRSNTYFIPIDRSIDSHHFHKLNKHVIFAHIVPDFVLFTRPTTRKFSYETMANDDAIYTVLSLEDIDNELYVVTRTITGNQTNPVGTYKSKILYPNIPIANGVIHLIAKPLCIENKPILFPYLPLKEKLATDPTLDYVWSMGQRSGFNIIFNKPNVSFTYFIPNDYAWKQMEELGIKFSGTNVDLLKRHLVISSAAYSMERLYAMTQVANNTNVPLQTLGGIIKIGVQRIGKKFYIHYHTSIIRVLKANYECTDGLIHILAGPIINL